MIWTTNLPSVPPGIQTESMPRPEPSAAQTRPQAARNNPQTIETKATRVKPKVTRTAMIVGPKIFRLAHQIMDQIADMVAQTMVPISVVKLVTHCLNIRKKLTKDSSAKSGTEKREPKQVKPVGVRSLMIEEIRMRQFLPRVRGYMEGHEI